MGDEYPFENADFYHHSEWAEDEWLSAAMPEMAIRECLQYRLGMVPPDGVTIWGFYGGDEGGRIVNWVYAAVTSRHYSAAEIAGIMAECWPDDNVCLCGR